jgi:ferrochelatase
MIGLAVVDFGGPQGEAELVPFLTRLLADVLPGPRAVKEGVAPFLARRRASVVAPNYARIGWSPLVPTHRKQVAALRALLPADLPVASGMMFTAPTMDDAVRELLGAGVDQLVVLPMFPHYSLATTGAAFAFLWEALVRAGRTDLPIRWIPAYPEEPSYLRALADTIREGVAATPGDPADPVHLVFSPHGLPLSFVQGRGDPYPDQIRTTVRRVLEVLDWRGPAHVGWQSRVGPVAWLTPSTPDVLAEVARSGGRRVCLVPVSFASEHIETLHEIDIEYRELAHELRIPHFGRAPALGTHPAFVEALAASVRGALADLQRYSCVRCLLPKGPSHRHRAACPNCRFTFPSFLREFRAFP